MLPLLGFLYEKKCLPMIDSYLHIELNSPIDYTIKIVHVCVFHICILLLNKN